jgi:hypothetical protein
MIFNLGSDKKRIDFLIEKGDGNFDQKEVLKF